jgi:hypothetical protein
MGMVEIRFLIDDVSIQTVWKRALPSFPSYLENILVKLIALELQVTQLTGVKLKKLPASMLTT